MCQAVCVALSCQVVIACSLQVHCEPGGKRCMHIAKYNLHMLDIFINTFP